MIYIAFLINTIIFLIINTLFTIVNNERGQLGITK